MASDQDATVPVRRALLSVDDKSGLLELAQGLRAHSVELWATEGTRKALGGPPTDVHAAEELTGVGAWFGGRVKTLHPGLFGGILAPRTAEGERELGQRGLVPIDLVVVNLYPFERRADEGADEATLIEAIDIGGVALARAAAKNHRWVTVASDPSDYPSVLSDLSAYHGSIRGATRRVLAAKTFDRIARYDRRIASVLAPPSSDRFPAHVEFDRESMALRYGENPHQQASVFRFLGRAPSPMEPASLELRKGEPLSFTNLLDLETAMGIVGEFSAPAAAVVKHATPCGAASGRDGHDALAKAVATDPVARYGCVVAINRPVEVADVEALHGVFVDLLAAPEIDPTAFELLSKRPKLKIVRVSPPDPSRPRWEAHSALGRLLLQEADRRQLVPTDLRPVTARTADAADVAALQFAWQVVRHAKSNAVVLAAGTQAVGIGGGQPTRVKAVELAVQVAGERARGAVLASDAFFPFADGVDVAGNAGVSAIIQPGGSVRDTEVIQAAERHRIAMYFTGWRVFRH